MSDLIAAYARHLGDEQRAESTIELYTYLLRRMDRELPFGLARANTDELRGWIFAPKPNEDERGDSCHSLYCTIARGFFRWVTDPATASPDERLDYDSAALLPRVKVEPGEGRPISVEQFRDVIARAAEPFRLWFLIAGLLGARCIEIAALDVGDVGERTLLHGKGRKDRWVPTHAVVIDAVRGLPPGPVVREADGSRMHRQRVSRLGNRELRRLGHQITMHRFRHTFGSEAYEQDHDIEAVRRLLGHSSVVTAQRYVARPDSALRQAALGAADRLLAA